MKHSFDIFDNLLEPNLPPPFLSSEQINSATVISSEQWSEFRKREQERQNAKKEIVRTEKINNVGKIDHFIRKNNLGRVVFLQSNWGGHDNIAVMEGVIDIIGHVLGIRRAY